MSRRPEILATVAVWATALVAVFGIACAISLVVAEMWPWQLPWFHLDNSLVPAVTVPA